MKGKARRLLSWVCVLALCMSLLPVTALAAGDGSSTTTVAKGSVTESQNGVTVNKFVSQKEDGSYQLTMEAYASNTVTTESKSIPLDIVIVLDQSGSMAYNFDGETTSANNARRQYAMKQAVNNFIDSVAQKYSQEANHQMAIVTFGSDASELANWTNVDASGQSNLKAQITGLPDSPAGATNVAEGMNQAKELMASKSGNSGRQKVVIVFTDGVPTTSSDFDTGVANRAIGTAKELKNAGVAVYSIGIFNGADPNQLYGDKWDYLAYDDINCNGEPGSYWGALGCPAYSGIMILTP